MQRDLVRKVAIVCYFVALVFLASGCKKQVGTTPPTPTPAPAPAQPTVTINASTTSVNPGDTVTLSWSSTDATDLIDRAGCRPRRAGRHDACHAECLDVVPSHREWSGR